MIRDYRQNDEMTMRLNRFSPLEVVAHVLQNTNLKRLVVDLGDGARVIVGWLNVQPNVWATFLVMDERAGMAEAKSVKRLLARIIAQEKPKELFTYSLECGELARWHRFLGFSIDVASKNEIIEGNTYNRWVMKWE